MVKTELDIEVKLLPPKSLGIFLLQCFSIAPALTAIEICFMIFKVDLDIGDALIIICVFIFPLLTLSFCMYYFSERCRMKIVFDKEGQKIRKLVKNIILKEVDLNSVTALISQRQRPGYYLEYQLILEKGSDCQQVLFDETTPFGTGGWERFAQKLSQITQIPLKRKKV